jgi:D-glycero-D-manno-heptose 1,7-bisphosphate phosphatase
VKRKALFLDRDGIITALVHYPSHGEWEAPRVPDDVRLLPGVADALRELVAAGWLLFVVSNQPNAAKGKATMDDIRAVHERVVRELGDVAIAEWFYCYHQGGDGCECRKPSPYFLLQAAERYELDLHRSWMAGDQDSDIACGHKAGVRTALVECPDSQGKRGAQHPDLTVRDLPQLARVLARQEASDDTRPQD